MYYLEEVRERDVDLLLFFFRLFFFFFFRCFPPPPFFFFFFFGGGLFPPLFFFICDTLNYEDGNHLDSLLSLSLSLSLLEGGGGGGVKSGTTRNKNTRLLIRVHNIERRKDCRK